VTSGGRRRLDGSIDVRPTTRTRIGDQVLMAFGGPPVSPTIAAHGVHVASYVQVLHDFLVGEEPKLDWPGSWKVHVVDEAAWNGVRADLRACYERLRATIQVQVASGDDAIGDALAVLAHTAYHLGAIRQIVRAVTR
jgi:hypothetical protein